MSAAARATLSALPPGLVWQADRIARSSAEALPTGFATLDAQLPGGGWPRGALIELLTEHPGIGEIQLLLPLLRSAPAERWIAWIAPPLTPYAPALAAAGVALDQLLLATPSTHAETLWATRQAVISGACAMVLAWPSRIDTAALRRLQLAAEESLTPLFLFRPISAARQSSPATLRLRLATKGNALAVHIVKRRGPALDTPIYLPIARRSGSSPDHPPSDLHALVRPDSSRPAATDIHARRG